MRVVHVNTEAAWGGGEAQTSYLIKGLRARGVENILVAQPGAQIAQQLKTEGIRVVGLRMRGGCEVGALVKLVRLLRELAPDVLHLHTSHAHTLGLLAGRLTRTSKIVATRRMDHEITGFFSAFKYRHTDHVVAISGAVHDILARGGVPKEKLSVIHSAVDCPNPYPTDDLRSTFGFDVDAPVIGTVATLGERKGHKHLFQALPELSERCPKLRLLVVGTGPEEDHLRQIAAELGLTEAIIFAGFRKDIPQVLNTLDVFVLASQREGLGVSLLEASCCGLPIVASNVGGIPEIIEDGVTGLLVPPADSRALAEKIEYLLEHREEARRLGRKARALIRERFSVEKMVQRYCDLYHELAQHRHRGRRT